MRRITIIRGCDQIFEGDQLPIPARYKISVWGTSPPSLICGLGETDYNMETGPKHLTLINRSV